MTRYISRSTLMAIAVGVLFLAWMASGMFDGEDSSAESIGTAGTRGVTLSDAVDTASGAASEGSVSRVGTISSTEQLIAEEVVVSARSEPNRSIELRAEAEGRVVELNAERGALVREGDRIARLDIRNRAARLTEIEALLEQHRLQFEAAQQLRGEGLLSEVQIAEARARLAATETALQAIQIEIAQLTITAPFDAMIQDRSVEIGDFVQVGDSVTTLVDTDPLIIVGSVSEQEVKDLAVGGSGTAVLVDGSVVEGRLRYVAPLADANTRTFRVELAVPNPQRSIRAGLTAELRLIAGEIAGHLLSPGLLTLDDSGTIGVKTVDHKNVVQFLPVTILRSGEAGVWVSGLPTQAQIISVGQGFVVPGSRVEPVPSGATAVKP